MSILTGLLGPLSTVIDRVLPDREARDRAKLELLKLVGATNYYIRAPFLIEGLLQGFIGSILGIVSLYSLFQWIKLKFSGPGILSLFEFAFFQISTITTIIAVSIVLCAVGSYTSMQKFLRI